MSVLCNLPDGTIEQGLAPVDPIKTRFFAASGITSIIDYMLLHGYDKSNYDYYDINTLHPSDDALKKYFKSIKIRYRKSDRKPRIIDAGKVKLAMTLIADNSRCVGEICEILGVSKATLYRYLND